MNHDSNTLPEELKMIGLDYSKPNNDLAQWHDACGDDPNELLIKEHDPNGLNKF
jgi:hypothetical protein